MSNTTKQKERKSDSFLVKVSPQEHDRIRQAAEALNLSKSEFVLGEALRKHEELSGITSFEHLEKKDGEWYFTGRKLKVFENFYLLSTSQYQLGTWADLYGLPRAAIDEAAVLCKINQKKAYETWVKEYEKDGD